jgi:hypothetical protein
MRTFTLLATLAAAALSVPAFAAPDAVPLAAGSAALIAVQTIPGPHHKLRAGDVDDVVGSYNLENGQTLRVSYAQRKLFAELDGNKTEIRAAGERTFVSATQDMTLVFDQLPFANNVLVTRK